MAEHRRAGHRTVPHTADLRVEAWGPTREACIEQAVLATVSAFVDTTTYAGPLAPRTVRVGADDLRDDTDLLVAALDEVIYLLEVADVVPLEVTATPAVGGLELRLGTAPAAGLTQVGAVPKAVALHGLRCAPGVGGWSCAVTLDV